MSRENPTWGAPRIHGGTAQAGHRHRRDQRQQVPRAPSQTWRTFLDSHIKDLVSIDFFTVPTIRFQVLYVFLVLAHERRLQAPRIASGSASQDRFVLRRRKIGDSEDTIKHSWLSFAALVAALAPGIDAQVFATSGPIPLESVGLPPQPPFRTLLGMVDPGKLATDPSITPKGGAVSEVFYEELRGMATPAGTAGAVEASVRTKFDEQGHVIEQVENRWNRETHTLYSYQDGRLVKMETTSPNGKKAAPTSWSYWTYEARGKLTEYRRGNGTAIQNHELGFHYDNKGRLLGFEYRQGADDRPFSRTEISYSNDGKTIVVTRTFAESKITDRSTRTLDDQGRVVRVMLDSEGRATKEQATKIFFRYDEQGRLVEQTTDAQKFSDSGAEHDLPPGTISIAYDDRIHTKTTRYSIPNQGSVESVVMQDESGATIGYSLNGGTEEASSKLECQYDRLANWISCRQIVENQGQRIIMKEFRRTITYW